MRFWEEMQEPANLQENHKIMLGNPDLVGEAAYQSTDLNRLRSLFGGVVQISTQSELDAFRPQSGFAIVTMGSGIDADIKAIFGTDNNKIEIHSYTVGGTTANVSDHYQEGISAIDGKRYRRFYSVFGGWGDFEINEVTETDLSQKMQYKGDYDVIPYAHYRRNDVYTWLGNLYIVNTEFSTTLVSPPQDFHAPDDTNYWTPLTININKTITTVNQLNNTTYVKADNMVLLLDDRLGNLTSILPSTHSELSICRMEIGKTLGAGGLQFIQKVVDIWGVEWQRYTTWSGSDYVWGGWVNVLEHVHVLNDLSDVNTTQSKTVPIDADKLFILNSATNTWESVLKADLNEIHVGTSTPTHNEKVWIDNTADLLVYKSATTATITPNNTLAVDKYNSNYAGGNTVLVDYPTFDTGKHIDYDDERVLVIKNTKAGTVTFVIETGINTLAGIEYNYLDKNGDTFDLDQNDYVEISYLYTMTSATTCDVLIRFIV